MVSAACAGKFWSAAAEQRGVGGQNFFFQRFPKKILSFLKIF